MIKSNLEQRIGKWYLINPVRCDELIAQGQTTTYIAREFRVSHVAVLKYINRTGQYESWVKKRKKITAREIKDRVVLREELKQQKKLEKERLLVEKKKQEISLEQTVLKAVRENLTTSPEELSEYTFIQSRMVSSILSRYKISRKQHKRETIPIIIPRTFPETAPLEMSPSNAYTPEQRAAILKIVQTKKPVALEQVGIQTEIDLKLIEKVLRDEKMLLDLPSRYYSPEIDALIAKGFNQTEIARKLGLPRSNIRMYASATGLQIQLSRQRQARQKAETKDQRRLFLDTLVQRQYQTVEQEYGRYSPRALDIFYQGKSMTRRFNFLEKLLRIAQVYAEAEDHGERLSYQELGDICELRLGTVGIDLSKMGLKSMCWNVENRTKVIPEQKETIDRSYFTGFGASDIAYFIGLPSNIIYQHFIATSKNGNKRERAERYLQIIHSKTFGRGGQKGDCLNYRHASQVYELDDLAQAEGISFTPEEVSGTVELNPRLVAYAREKRPEIEDKIKELLTILYPKHKITSPYL